MNLTAGFNIPTTDLLWFKNKWYQRQGGEKYSGCNGHMETITNNRPYSVSSIVYLPIIDNAPNDCDTIFMSLTVALKKCKTPKQETCIVTYDQPLYQKA